MVPITTFLFFIITSISSFIHFAFRRPSHGTVVYNPPGNYYLHMGAVHYF
ncbi:hypothetical protein Hanom_Chr14g01321701 [Helianthus anomalus]